MDIEDLDELTVVETIKAGKSIYKAGPAPTKVGTRTPATLPELSGMRWDRPAAASTSRPPRRGIYAFAKPPSACGCNGCTLGHLIEMGQREVGAVGERE
jgi:hypothetical protein